MAVPLRNAGCENPSRMRAVPRTNSDFQIEIVPAEGHQAATFGERRLRYVAVFGQFSVKLSTRPCVSVPVLRVDASEFGSGPPALYGDYRRRSPDLFAAREAARGPVQAPPPSAVAAGPWGAPVAGVMWPTVEGRATPRRRPQSKRVLPWRSRRLVSLTDPLRKGPLHRNSRVVKEPPDSARFWTCRVRSRRFAGRHP
jgi:hypothetical protein